MNASEKLLIEGINEFNHYVAYLDSLIRKEYTQNINPVKASTKKLISRQGFILDNNKRIEYKFHGRGCWFIIESKVVDFDYLGDSWEYVGFGISKLHEFFKTSVGYELFWDLQELSLMIEDLEHKHILFRANPPYATFNLVNKYRVTRN